MSVIVFIIFISILVIVHEWGHYIAAKKVGIKVEKFSVGFGPKLFSRMIDNTEFMVCAIPLGGYVKPAGEDRATCTGAPEEYFSHSVWHRAIVVVMGPLINIVFAYLCFYMIFVTGFPMRTTEVGKVMDDYPAQVAGIMEGDRIVKIDQKGIDNFDDLQETVTGSEGRELLFTIERGEEMFDVMIAPQVKVVDNLFGQEEKISIIGIQPTDDLILIKYGIGESFVKSYQQLKDVIVTTYKAFYYIIVGSMPAKDALAGPIRIFDIVAQSLTHGLTYFLYIMAVISANLAIVNLFPVPVLDGGHLVFLFFEAVLRKPLPAKLEENLTKAGFILLMGLFAFLMYNDSVQVGWIEKISVFFKGLGK